MQDLFRKYINNQCSPEEVKQLLQQFNVGENEILLRSFIAERLELIDNDDNGSQWTEATGNIYIAIKKEIDAGKTKVVPVFRKIWFQAAAAAVLLFGAFALYRMVGKNNSPQQEIVKTNTEKQDIAPGGNKAVLTLADGSQIILDSAANGNLVSQGNTKVIKLDGQLAYNTSGSTTEILYNTISTPKGGQYQLVLADGSKVWLNAASSLRFPATFIGSERKVELMGEGYFEVAKSVTASGAKQPFKVNVAGKGEVEVLGTHFNINAYNDEASINTTLLEGSVRISATDSRLLTPDSRLLSPGQQAQLNTNGQIALDSDPDIDKIMAWKNGWFEFDQTDLGTIMRQVSRWYDVDVVYEGKQQRTEKFGGRISKNLPLSAVLQSLKSNGIVIRLEGRKLIVQ